MHTGKSNELHYKMYKKGRAWIIAGMLVVSWGVSEQVAKADVEPPSDDANEPVNTDTQLNNKAVIIPTSNDLDDTNQEVDNNVQEQESLPMNTEDSDNHQVEDSVSEDKAVGTQKYQENIDSNNIAANKEDTGNSDYDSDYEDLATTSRKTLASDTTLRTSAPSDSYSSSEERKIDTNVARISDGKQAAVQDQRLNVENKEAAVAVPETAIAQGHWGISHVWYIDSSVLHFTSGVLFAGKAVSEDWQAYNDVVTKVSFDDEIVAPEDCGNLFSALFKVKSYEHIERLDTSNTKNMTRMFYENTVLEEIDISRWNINNVIDMTNMFYLCYGLKTAILPNSPAESLLSTPGMFEDCHELESVKLDGIDLRTVQQTSSMFAHCNKLSQFDIDVFHLNGERRGIFEDCTSLTSLTVDLTNEKPQNFLIFDDRRMFKNCTSLKEIKFINQEKSKVDMMMEMFSGCTSLQTIDLSSFDTSNNDLFIDVFKNCRSLERINLNPLDLHNATYVVGMFAGCSGLKSIDLSAFSEAKLESISGLLRDCSGLTSVDLSVLDTSQLTSMDNLLNGCSGLTNVDLMSIQTGKVSSISGLISGCSGLTSIDLHLTDNSKITNISHLLSGCTGLTSVDLSPLNNGILENVSGLLDGCTGLTSVDLSQITTGNVTDMSYMLSGCTGLTELDVSSLITDNVTNMNYMFAGCTGLNELDLKTFNTGLVETMQGLVCGCTELTKLDLSGFDTRQVSDMSFMFAVCPKLEDLNLADVETNQVNNMMCMFYGDESLKTLDLAKFNTSQVEILALMFANCRSLTTLNLSSFDTSNITLFLGMFANCNRLESIDLSSFQTSQATNFSWMFLNNYALQTLDLSHFDMRQVNDELGSFQQSILEMTNYSDIIKLTTNSDYSLMGGYSGVDQFLANTHSLKKLVLSNQVVLSDDLGDVKLPDTTTVDSYAGRWFNTTDMKHSITVHDLMATYYLGTAPAEKRTFVRSSEPEIQLKQTKIKHTIGLNLDTEWSANDNYIGGSNEFGDPIPIKEVEVTWDRNLNLNTPGIYTVSYRYLSEDGIYAKVSQTIITVVYPVKVGLKSTDISMYIGPKTATWRPANNVLTATDELGKDIKEKLDYQITPILARSRSSRLDMTQPGRYRIDYLYDGDILGSAFLTLLKSKATVDAVDKVIIADPKTTWNSLMHHPTAIDEDGQAVTTIKTSIVDQASGKNVNVVNTHQAGNYQITFSFLDGVENRVYKVVNLKILANQARIKTKDSQLTVGEQWHAKDNFISATDYTGKPLTIDDLKVDGIVNWQQPGQYLVRYTYDKNPELTPITKTALITVVAAVVPVDPNESGNGNVQPEPEYPEAVPDQTIRDQQPNPAPVVDVDTGKPVKPTTEIKSKLKPETNVRKADFQQETESDSNVGTVKQQGSNKLNTDNQQLSSANGQKSLRSLPQTNDSRSLNWMNLLGMSLLGLIGFLGFRRKTR